MNNTDFEIGDNIWFENPYIGLTPGTIFDVNEYKNNRTNEMEKIFTIHDDKNGGKLKVRADKIWGTKIEAEAAFKLEHDNIVKGYKEEITDVNALIKFMYDNTVSTAEEYTDWDARQAVRERAKELLNIELSI